MSKSGGDIPSHSGTPKQSGGSPRSGKGGGAKGGSHSSSSRGGKGKRASKKQPTGGTPKTPKGKSQDTPLARSSEKAAGPTTKSTSAASSSPSRQLSGQQLPSQPKLGPKEDPKATSLQKKESSPLRREPSPLRIDPSPQKKEAHSSKMGGFTQEKESFSVKDARRETKQASTAEPTESTHHLPSHHKDDYGVARRLLSFTRGGDSEIEETTSSMTVSFESSETIQEIHPPKNTGGKSEKVPQQTKKQKPPVKQSSSEDRGVESPGIPGGGGGESGLSKAEMKKIRREKQEAQRAAKQQKKGENVSKSGKQAQEIRVSANVQADDEKMQAKVAKKLAKQQIPQRTEAMKHIEMFSHLHQYRRELSVTKGLSFGSGSVHPAVVKLGLQYSEGIICGSNARCIALLAAFQQVIKDYKTPEEKVLSRDLESTIKPYISFLHQCRPLSVSMGNAIKYLKWRISTVTPDTPEEKAKTELCQAIDDYYRAKIQLADEVIVEKTKGTIKEGDVVLVHAFSSIVVKCLLASHEQKPGSFRVIVVDSRPRMEGYECLKRLVQHGIKCSYVLINAVPYIMKEVTKVFVGAHALLANGYVMSRVGTSLIALVAKTFNVPVLVCCETYKFCDRVQTDAFVFNELGDPSDLARSACHLTQWKDRPSLALLNLAYDVTCPDHVAMVITERGTIPCTSVPVVLRVTKDEERAEIMRFAETTSL